MEDVKRVLEMEEPGEEAYGKLLETNMSLSSALDYLENNNKTYFGLEKGEGGLEDILCNIRDAYKNFRKTLILTEIPAIPKGSNIYNRLIELYEPLLEKYPTISGRIQLLHAILSST